MAGRPRKHQLPGFLAWLEEHRGVSHYLALRYASIMGDFQASRVDPLNEARVDAYSRRLSIEHARLFSSAFNAWGAWQATQGVIIPVRDPRRSPSRSKVHPWDWDVAGFLWLLSTSCPLEISSFAQLTTHDLSSPSYNQDGRLRRTLRLPNGNKLAFSVDTDAPGYKVLCWVAFHRAMLTRLRAAYRGAGPTRLFVTRTGNEPTVDTWRRWHALVRAHEAEATKETPAQRDRGMVVLYLTGGECPPL